MGRIGRALVTVSACVIAYGCVGAIPKDALDARGTHVRGCEARPPNERAECFSALPAMRDDEPREGPCMGFVAYIRWGREAAPDCVKELEQDDEAGRGPMCSEAKPPTLADAKQGKAGCEARLARVEKVAACLRRWSTPYENVQGPSVSCYVRVAGERKIALAQLAVLDKIIAELEPSSSQAPASSTPSSPSPSPSEPQPSSSSAP